MNNVSLEHEDGENIGLNSKPISKGNTLEMMENQSGCGWSQQ